MATNRGASRPLRHRARVLLTRPLVAPRCPHPRGRGLRRAGWPVAWVRAAPPAVRGRWLRGAPLWAWGRAGCGAGRTPRLAAAERGTKVGARRGGEQRTPPTARWDPRPLPGTRRPASNILQYIGMQLCHFVASGFRRFLLQLDSIRIYVVTCAGPIGYCDHHEMSACDGQETTKAEES